jgi:hypothetical protein
VDSFFLDIIYCDKPFRCFLQKLSNRQETIYVLNVSDGCLIDLFGAKKVMYCAGNMEVGKSEDGGTNEKKSIWDQVISEDIKRSQQHFKSYL